MIDLAERIEFRVNDFQGIMEVAGEVAKSVVDRKPGFFEEQIVWLGQTRKDFKDMGKMMDGKSVNKNRKKELEDKYPNMEDLDRGHVLIVTELTEALECLGNSLNMEDTETRRSRNLRGEMVGLEVAKAGAIANGQFVDFFIKIDRKYNLPEEKLMELYDLIFNVHGLKDECRMVGFETFPAGLEAALRAYCCLRENLEPGDMIRVGTLEEDCFCGGDLVVVNENKEVVEMIEVKGVGKMKEKIVIYDINNEIDRQRWLKVGLENCGQRVRGDRQATWLRIEAHSDSHPEIKHRWVDVRL